ncbi:HIT-like domain-containing protein [Aspergillus foveolatus]|uniref:HIT-like domain-containing protein n=1 Tax=Aspergillus foveolatus TaxID=210207 RepID=UPI003CCCD844
MSPACPFCSIAAAYPPVRPSAHLQPTDSTLSAATPTPGEDGHAFIVLSTKHVLAFLDIMPLTRGHILVVPRRHYEKLTEVGVGVSRELGTWLPILSRAVMRTVFGESESQTTDGTTTDPSWNWNVVQNNGVGAAQVVPHVHFHIVPRPPLGAAGTAAKMSFVMFGRGKREDLDDEEAEKFIADLRMEIAREVERVRSVEGVDLEEEFTEKEGFEREGKGRL